jgi:hypothetical protein
MKKMASSARMVATSGCVMRRVKSGVRCVWSVRVMPREVERSVRRGFAREVRRRGGRRAA